MSRSNVVVMQAATLTERIEAMRKETTTFEDGLRRVREAMDTRIVELVRHRANQAVDAILLAD